MQQVNNSLLVMSPGDAYNPLYDGFLKIYLSGTIDINIVGNKIPWQQKFINGLASLTEDPNSQYGKCKFLVFNPYAVPQNPQVSLDNPEYVQKLQWELQTQGAADVIFCNFLRKSQSISAITGFLLNANTGKVITRCPMDCALFPQVKTVADTYQIPVVGDSDSGLKILELMFERIPKFNQLMNFNIGE